MNFAICPNGSGEINVHMSRNEANELAEKLRFVISEFDWDDYAISSFRNSVERAVQSSQESQMETDTEDVRGGSRSVPMPRMTTASDWASQPEQSVNFEFAMPSDAYENNLDMDEDE